MVIVRKAYSVVLISDKKESYQEVLDSENYTVQDIIL